MANSKLIVVEGPQGAGKTTITDYLRYTIPYTNLYRLCGTADSTPTGKKKAETMYRDLVEYLKKLGNQSINLVFDRTFFTEENYCRLKYKEYSFTDVYEELLEDFAKLDFEIYYVTLYLEEKSINQQKVYLEMSDEIEKKYPNIHCLKIENSKDLELTKQELKEKIGF